MSMISFLLAVVSLPTITGIVQWNPSILYLYVILVLLVTSFYYLSFIKSSAFAIWWYNWIFGFAIYIKHVSIYTFNNHHERIDNQSETNWKRSHFYGLSLSSLIHLLCIRCYILFHILHLIRSFSFLPLLLLSGTLLGLEHTLFAAARVIAPQIGISLLKSGQFSNTLASH
jgi:hypothetical protein